MQRVVLTAVTVWGNRGAQMMLETAVGELLQTFPDARFSVFSYYPVQDRRRVSHSSIEILDGRPLTLVAWFIPLLLVYRLLRVCGVSSADRLLPRPLKVLEESDLVLDLGGITFADGRLLFVLYNVCSLLPAILLGRPIVKMAQAMGPFRNRLNRFAATRSIRQLKKVFARGASTAAHLATLPIGKEIVERAADIGFLFDTSYALSAEGQFLAERFRHRLQRYRNQGRDIVGIVPSSLVLKMAQREKISNVNRLSSIILELLRSGRVVLVLPHATRLGSKRGRNNDLLAINRVRASLLPKLSAEERSRVLFFDDDVSTGVLHELLGAVDVVVVERFHAMVTALSRGVVPIVIGWSFKYREVMREFGLEKFCYPLTVESATVLTSIEKVLERRAQYRAQVLRLRPMVRLSASRQIDFVREFLSAGRFRPRPADFVVQELIGEVWCQQGVARLALREGNARPEER